MSRAIAPTRLELKRQRDALVRYQRFLPALKRKQQQLQLALEQAATERSAVQGRLNAARARVEAYRSLLGDLAGVDLTAMSIPTEVVTTDRNVAGVRVPAFSALTFPEVSYSLFGSAPWTDRALSDLRAVARIDAELQVLDRQNAILARELRRVVQRVNLFEKVKIPRAAEAVRRIRIHLGDEMSAAVGRAKLAKRRSTAAGPPAISPEGTPEGSGP